MEKNQHTNFHVWFLSCSVHSTGCRTFCPTDPTAIDIDPYGYGKTLYSKMLFQFCKVYHPLCIRLLGKSLFDHHNILANHIRALQAYKKSNKIELKWDLKCNILGFEPSKVENVPAQGPRSFGPTRGKITTLSCSTRSVGKKRTSLGIATWIVAVVFKAAITFFSWFYETVSAYGRIEKLNWFVSKAIVHA